MILHRDWISQPVVHTSASVPPLVSERTVPIQSGNLPMDLDNLQLIQLVWFGMGEGTLLLRLQIALRMSIRPITKG